MIISQMGILVCGTAEFTIHFFSTWIQLRKRYGQGWTNRVKWESKGQNGFDSMELTTFWCHQLKILHLLKVRALNVVNKLIGYPFAKISLLFECYKSVFNTQSTTQSKMQSVFVIVKGLLHYLEYTAIFKTEFSSKETVLWRFAGEVEEWLSKC